MEFETDSDQLETDKEDQLKESDILNLLQADGSQEEIIKEARYKKGMVVHGPPGTGKSQVIVNLITDALQQQKKVLVPIRNLFCLLSYMNEMPDLLRKLQMKRVQNL